jgi:PAS domain S-box-containing protein
MKDERKTKKQLVAELVELRQELAELKMSGAEHRPMDEVLRESEERSRSIIESIPMGMHMYQLELDGRLVFIGANPVADEILGVDNAQFVGKTIEEAFPALTETEIPERYRLAASRGEVWQTDQIVYEEGQIEGVFEVRAFQTSRQEEWSLHFLISLSASGWNRN